MKNLILLRRAEFERANYVRKADPTQEYWVDFSKRRLDAYRARFGTNFHLIIVGNEEEATDFFTIPFSHVEGMFSADTMTRDKKPRQRWICAIHAKRRFIVWNAGAVEISRFRGLLPTELGHQDLNQDSTREGSDLAPPESPERSLAKVYRILRDTRLSRALKRLHEDRCQICGHVVTLANGETYSEAHHIKPLGKPHNGPDIAGNIIVLCPNHHALCDLGGVALAQKDIRKGDGHTVDPSFLTYHNSKIAVESRRAVANGMAGAR